VNWQNGNTSVKYKAVKFEMANFRGMLGQLREAIYRALWEDRVVSLSGYEIFS